MVRYFEGDLKSSIKAEIDQDAFYLGNYEELVAKAVRVEAKAGLRPSSYVRQTDQQVSRGNWSAHTTAHKVQTHGAIKDYYGNKSRAKASISTSTQDSKPFDKARKDKKQKQHKAKQDSTPATGVNMAEVGNYKTRKKDISKITYYNCNKKGHYLNKYVELWKSKKKYQSQRPPRRWLVLEKKL